MLAIFRKEFSSFFHSARGYAFLSANVLLSGLFVVFCNLIYGSARIERTFELMVFAAIFTIPLLTIKLFAAERESNNEALIFSLPISAKEIVLGKIFAVLAMIGLEAVLLLILPLILSIFGIVNFASAYAALLGFVILSVAFAAICIFISAASKKVLVAGIVSYGVSALIFVVWLVLSKLSIPDALQKLSFIDIYDSFALGAPSLFSLVFYISIAVFFIYLTFRVLEKRHSPAKVSARPIIAVVLAVVLVGLNVLCALMPKKISAIDLSDNKAYSLSDNTKKFLSGIEKDVKVYVIDADSSSVAIDYKLSLFGEYSEHVSVEYVTTEDIKDDLVALGYTDGTAISPYSILVKSDARSAFIDAMNLYSYYHPDFGEMSYSTYNSYLGMIYQYAMQDQSYYETFNSLYNNTVSYYKLEPMLASYIEYSLVDVIPTLYYMTSHGTQSMSSILGRTLADMGVKELDLAAISEMPNDLGSLIINAPDTDFTEREIALLASYLDNGGAAVFITNPESTKMTNLMTFLASTYGVSTTQGLVAQKVILETEAAEGEEATASEITSYTVLAKANPDHDSLYALASESVPVVNANHFSILNNTDPSVIVTPILTTDESAFIDGAELSEGQKTLAVAIEKETEGGTTEIAWFTGADSLVDANIQLTNFYAIMYAATWGIESFESELGDILPTVMSEDMLTVTNSTINGFILTTVILTLGAIVLGAVVCNVRKRRKPIEEVTEE